MVNYANAVIYRLVCTLPNFDEFYVGSTCQTLTERMYGHRQECKRKRCESKLYKYMNDHGVHNFRLELVEKYPCETNTEKIMREQYWFDKMSPTLNMNPAYLGGREAALKRYNSKPSTKAYYREYKRKHPQKYTEEQKQRRKEYNKRKFAAMSQEDRDALNAKRRARRAAKRAAKKV